MWKPVVDSVGPHFCLFMETAGSEFYAQKTSFVKYHSIFCLLSLRKDTKTLLYMYVPDIL